MKKKLKWRALPCNALKKTLRIMRWCLFLLIVSVFQVQAVSGYAQKTKLSLDLKNASIETILNEIESNSEFYFFCNRKLVDLERKTDIQISNQTIDQILSEVFKGVDVEHVITGRQIVLIPGKYLSQAQNENLPPPLTIKGKVTDSDGQSLPGVTVVVKGTTQGTVTNASGEYLITNIPEDATLQFSFVGMRTQEIPVAGKTHINVTMSEEAIGVDEVVVVGYGTQKKVNLTGAVDMVKGDVLENRAITSVASGLQGLIPGLTISSSSGQPGNPQTSILVRGVNTINSDTGPLVLIDGVVGGSIDLLNPRDIESVSVLKDAASSAIYGARAANGVILITTKGGGKSEQLKVDYSGYVGFQTPTTLPEMASGRDYMTLLNEAMSNAGLAKVFSDEAFSKYDSKNYPNDYSNTNWVSEIYKDHSTLYNHSLGLSGGTEKSSYYMSYGFVNQDGLIVSDPYESNRHNFKARITTDLSNWLKVDGNISYIDFYKKDAAASGTSGVFRLAQRISPLLPVMWQEDRGNGWEDSDIYSFGAVSNPVNIAKNSGYDKLRSRIANGIFNAELKLSENLNVKGQYAFNHSGNNAKKYSAIIKKYKVDGSDDPGNDALKNSAFESYNSYLTQTLNATVNYTKDIQKHSLNFIAGISKEWGYNNWISASRDKIIYEGVEVVSGGTENIENNASGVEWGINSVFGRVNYNFDEKYLFEANVRYDGTSRFSSNNNNRWGFFPSFSAGWKFSKENFMSFAESFLTMGKLRASWGELGNQNVGDYYPYLTSLELIDKSYPIGGIQNVGVYQPVLNNQNIKWETLRMFNLGIDLQLFNNQFGVSFDWFKKNNLDAILKPIYPASLGSTSQANLPYVNMGEIENKGWELNIFWNDNIGKLKYSTQFNISDSKNRVLDLGKSAPYLGSEEYRNVGDPLNAFYGFVTDGLFQPEDFEYLDEQTGVYKNPKVPTRIDLVQPGDVKYMDISGADGAPDGVIDDYDKSIIGERYPRYTFSLRNSFEWKSFDFAFLLQGIGKVNGYLDYEARHCFVSVFSDYSIPQKVHLDRWTPNNKNASYPRLYYGQTHNVEVSDYWIEDASFLRLKNIQFGYTLPSRFIRKTPINRLRVYFSADNLLTFTNYYYAYDPEIRASSGDSYPQVKTFTLGLNVSFK
ncbi:SusC/RagA family TonB-linked outer membrane protein [Mariniphaga sediminis]|uniref:SusC/RagA family TonB-linked outer membrane protein n=1 Tax=Mariniphaga sediminis TaxID=1628158 RepID=A0A399CS42_9BACT|nr:TonB-dependent receptor [Mariniphaga sediminis]RIH62779.1 SusC/RagA family TonB-linked outer membrane protein [Mariniphaga sediminis]